MAKVQCAVSQNYGQIPHKKIPSRSSQKYPVKRRSLGCFKRLVTSSKEKEIPPKSKSTAASPRSQRASVIRTSWLGGRLEIFSECGPSASRCSPIGTNFALCPLAVVVRIPCRIALQRTPAHGTPLGLHWPPAPPSRARNPIRLAWAVVYEHYSSRRAFRDRSKLCTSGYYGVQERGVERSEGQHEREEEGACRF